MAKITAKHAKNYRYAWGKWFKFDKKTNEWNMIPKKYFDKRKKANTSYHESFGFSEFD